MLKTLTRISAFVIILGIMLLSGCSGDYKVGGGPALNAEVISNGGMAVKKGDYLYFINGTSSVSADNTFGKAVKGSIVRMNLNDTKDKVIVVPKVVLSSYSDGGFSIFGDRIYYTSPSVKKDKNGNTLTSYLDFFSCKLDGSDTKEIMTTISNSNAYKFYQKEDGNVSIVFIDSSKVYKVDAEKGGKSKTVLIDSYTGNPVFAADGYIYFNQTLYKNDSKTETYGYNRLARLSFCGGDIEDIAYPDGTKLTEEKYVLTLSDVKIFDKTTLFYTKKAADGTKDPKIWNEPFSVSYVLGDSAEKIIVASSTTETFDFTDRLYDSPTSFLGVKNNLYYVTNTYDNNNMPKLSGIELMPKPTKLLFTDGDFVYYINNAEGGKADVLHKKQYKGEGVAFSSKGVAALADVSFVTSGLSPELIGGYLYFVRADGDYTNYLYRVLLDGNAGEAELISIIAEADKKAE